MSQSVLTLRIKEKDDLTELRPVASAAVIFVLFVSLGFPGSYNRVFGEPVGKAFEYAAFLLELLLMVWITPVRLGKLRIPEVKKNYLAVYAFLLVVVAVSTVGTSNLREEFISCVRFCVTALFALWMAEHLSVRSFLSHFCLAQLLFVIASVCFPLLFPAYDIHTDTSIGCFVGIKGVKNSAATELCLAIILEEVLLKLSRKDAKRGAWLLYILLAAQVVLLILTRGLGAIVTCVLATAIVLLYKGKWRWNLGLVWIAVSVAFLVFALKGLPLLEPILTAVGKTVTLTGRVPLWNRLIEMMQTTHTWTGFGYAHFWLDEEALELLHSAFKKYSYLNTMSSGAHNNLLELWVNAGLIGVAAFCAMLVVVFRRPKRLEKDRYLLCLAFMVTYTVSGLLERKWGTYEYNTQLMFLIAAYACCQAETPQESVERAPEA